MLEPWPRQMPPFTTLRDTALCCDRAPTRHTAAKYKQLHLAVFMAVSAAPACSSDQEVVASHLNRLTAKLPANRSAVARPQDDAHVLFAARCGRARCARSPRRGGSSSRPPCRTAAPMLHRLVDNLAEGSLVEAEVAHWGRCRVDPITRRGSAVTDRSGSPRCRCVSQPTGRISGRVRAPVHVVAEDDHDAPWATRSLPAARRPRRTDAADRAGSAARTWLLVSGPSRGRRIESEPGRSVGALGATAETCA